VLRACFAMFCRGDPAFIFRIRAQSSLSHFSFDSSVQLPSGLQSFQLLSLLSELFLCPPLCCLPAPCSIRVYISYLSRSYSMFCSSFLLSSVTASCYLSCLSVLFFPFLCLVFLAFSFCRPNVYLDPHSRRLSLDPGQSLD
jgi:hypothetical protein